MFIDYLFQEFFGFAVIFYLWAILGMFTFGPASLILLLFPRLRKLISVQILVGNFVSLVLLITLLNSSVSVGAMMSV